MSATISLFVAIIGMILGTAGFAMSLMSYLRDRPQLTVMLQWDMTALQTQRKCGLVKVANVGRRPIFVSVVFIEMPKRSAQPHLLLLDSAVGTKLSEGDKPAGFRLEYEDLSPYSIHWRKMRACVEDSAGKRYYSPYPDARASPPSWVIS